MHRHHDAILLRVVDQADCGHLAHLQAVQGDLGADFEARDRAREVRNQLKLVAEARGLRRLEGSVERKFMVGRGHRQLGIGRCVESDAAQQQGAQRFHLQRDALRTELHRHTRGVPERRVVVHVLIVGRAHEGMDGDAARQITELPAKNGADLEVAKEDRRAQADRAQPLGLQPESGALGPRLQDRWILLADEMVARRTLFARWPHADVGAGNERFETGDVAGEKLGLDHPEDRLVGQERHGLVHRLHRDQHAGHVGRQTNALHRAHDDVLVSELGLAGGEAGGAVEGDDDGGTALGVGVPNQPRRDEERDQRHDPDQRNAPAALGARRRQLCRLSTVAHCRSRSIPAPAG